MFSRQDFGAHSLAILNGIYDAAVLIRGDQVQLSCIAGNMLPLQKGAGRSERERAGLLNSAAKHAAPRQIEERTMELRVQIDIAIERFHGQLGVPDEPDDLHAGRFQ